ncbi:metal ABC transporter permease [Carnobacteriaceae bacterium zg-84]|uniref:metal ABC transporter permease n=1 Tax=Granulicatella sp. zg-84 TaxID=2678503 RepID=UPI0013C0F269|nr:metal ABC transporter permease [Granulicatella sp. zg-84]NEW66602.1 metal ABC transporter permease [Granulicatella sp. zg-84]QMI86253.1 metal ABC transporter permease [Carnobacteriaceae bacterium zg-84]
MLDTLLILYLTALACGSLGTILVVRNESMIADALSHSVLLGIVLGFFISNSLDSPLLIIGAALFGVFTVFFIDKLMISPKITHDAATGLVFPLLFSIAVILISMFARNVHLDLDMVLMGEIIFASLNTTNIFGIDIPISLIKISIICFINILFLSMMYRRLSLFLFDSTQARLVGLKTKVLQTIIMLLVSFTTVISFDMVGSITVICFFVGPAMSALLFAKHYKQLLFLTALFSLLNCVIGFFTAIYLDVTVSGTTTTITLITLLLCVYIKHILKNK